MAPELSLDSVHQHAAVHVQRFAGHVARRVGQEEHCGSGDIIGAAGDVERIVAVVGLVEGGLDRVEVGRDDPDVAVGAAVGDVVGTADGEVVRRSVKKLRQFAKSDKPFY